MHFISFQLSSYDYRTTVWKQVGRGGGTEAIFQPWRQIHGGWDCSLGRLFVPFETSETEGEKMEVGNIAAHFADDDSVALGYKLLK